MRFQNLNKEIESFYKLYSRKPIALHVPDITNLKNKVSIRLAWQLSSNVNYLKKYPKMNLSNSNDLFKKIINIPSGSKVLSKLKKK